MLQNLTLACVAVVMLAGPAQAELQLAMLEQDGCIYCARWDAEIGPIYPKTAEGAAAPLRRIDIDETLPDDVVLIRPAIFTPTFVLLDDGQEISRLEGYPGADFFWPLIGEMIADASD